MRYPHEHTRSAHADAAEELAFLRSLLPADEPAPFSWEPKLSLEEQARFDRRDRDGSRCNG